MEFTRVPQEQLELLCYEQGKGSVLFRRGNPARLAKQHFLSTIHRLLAPVTHSPLPPTLIIPIITAIFSDFTTSTNDTRVLLFSRATTTTSPNVRQSQALAYPLWLHMTSCFLFDERCFVSADLTPVKVVVPWQYIGNTLITHRIPNLEYLSTSYVFQKAAQAIEDHKDALTGGR
ncbi:hypothetical protein BDP27DRAFT_1419505 [Rhodocollybia butyracea]|uniref:Uncharacterized protein n=1 Tax=Rhodocollybia butyracea TaxID=206335 RepID=A0A9P5PYS7_9AGAR|nr:hypothetical protein BDP27DRAFT_1419505 [Rhodocollybia butyracea]